MLLLFVVTFCANDIPFQFNILGLYIPSHSSSLSLTRSMTTGGMFSLAGPEIQVQWGRGRKGKNGEGKNPSFVVCRDAKKWPPHTGREGHKLN